MIVTSINTNTNKKLFRDTDDSYVGGVASGLAHYFGISPAWIRVLFILFFFLPVPFTTLAYIILWIVVPSAKTSADKIRMNGEAVSVASIKNKIESVLPEIEKEITDFDKEYAKGLWGKVKYYLKKTINVLLITSSKLLKIVSIIFGYILMFYSFLGGLITSLIVLFLGSVNSAITNSTSSEIVINGNTIYELNDLLRIDIVKGDGIEVPSISFSQKGDFTLGLDYSQNNENYFYGYDVIYYPYGYYNTLNMNFQPRIGYFFNDNIEVGLAYKSGNNNNERKHISYNPSGTGDD